MSGLIAIQVHKQRLSSTPIRKYLLPVNAWPILTQIVFCVPFFKAARTKKIKGGKAVDEQGNAVEKGEAIKGRGDM